MGTIAFAKKLIGLLKSIFGIYKDGNDVVVSPPNGGSVVVPGTLDIGELAADNVLVNGATKGTSAVGVVAIANGTAPGSQPANETQLYSADISAGNAALHIVSEGTVAAVTQGGLTVQQKGGTPGTDEVQIYHDGTNGYAVPMDGQMVVGTAAAVKSLQVTGAVAIGIVFGASLNNRSISLNYDAGGLMQVSGNPVSWCSSTATTSGQSPDTVLSRVGPNQIIQAATVATAVAGGATTTTRTVIKKTGIADNTATAVITVTVPNANHAAAIKLTFLASNGSTDAFESSRIAEGTVVVARTTGANAVAAVTTLEQAQIATVVAGATITLAYDLSAISGAVGATNTFDVRVTIDDSGNLGSNQVVVLAELINAEASGVTMAAA